MRGIQGEEREKCYNQIITISKQNKTKQSHAVPQEWACLQTCLWCSLTLLKPIVQCAMCSSV